MTNNIPNNDEMVTKINFISQDYVEDYSVVSEVVKESTENVSGVTTRAFTNRGFHLMFHMVRTLTSPETMILSKILVPKMINSLR